MRVFHFVLHILAVVLLTILTQIGGLAYLIYLWLKPYITILGWKRKLLRFGLFAVIYSVLSFIIVPILASNIYNRKALPITHSALKPLRIYTYMILEMLMESIFAIVDIAFVSQVSTNAVATIGLTESVVTLVYAVAIGVSMAATAMVARRIGEKDPEGASKVAVQAIFLGVFIASIVSVIGIIYPKEILGLMI